MFRFRFRNQFFSSILLMLISLFIGTIACANSDKIGSLRKVSGNNLVQREGQVEKIKAIDGLAIYQNDTISTGDSGSLGIVFKDSSRISLGSNSKLTVNKFIFNPSQKKFSMLSKLMKGSLAYQSGKLSKLSPGSVTFETPDATIGTRGTSFIINVEQ